MTQAMTRDVPFLDRKRIELESKLLLDRYAQATEPVLGPPVPIEPILELHLGLRLSIQDLRAMFGVDDVLGAIWIEKREVMVDQQLDPDEHPDLEGRYHFTLAHEVGHWQLHRKHHLRRRAAGEPSFICRSSERRKSIEWQADYFAACLLMPKAMLFAAWRECCSSHPVTLAQLQSRRRELLDEEIVAKGIVPQTPEEEDDMLLEWAARPVCEPFRVSTVAMRIRLEQLGLLVR
jgi:hypothetical protein